MAYNIRILDASFPAGADLTDEQFKFISLNSDGEAVLASAGDLALGVLQHDPDESQASAVRVAGISKVVAGATVGSGEEVEVGADGKAIELDSGNCLGICLEGGDEDEIITVLVDRIGDTV